MATTIEAAGELRMIALDQIAVDSNVRQHAEEDVDAIAGSIALLGQLTPAIVRRDGVDRYVLVAGHKRYAALKQLGHTEIRVEVREADAEHAERAAENIVRTRLNPYEPGTIASDATLSVSAGCDGAWLREDSVSSRWFESAGGFSCREAVSVDVSGSDATLLR